MSDAPKKTLADKLQSINKPTLYLILVLVTSIPLFFKIVIPDEPDPPSQALFEALASPKPVTANDQQVFIPEGGTVLIQSDWTNSTRGESLGQFKAVMRILMRRHVKACMFSLADPQAPQVVRDAMQQLNTEQLAHGQPEYKEWEDWVHIGFFPSAEATSVAMAADLHKAFAGRKSSNKGEMTDVFKSPVFANVKSLKDIPLYILITASNTSVVALQRLSGQVPLAFLVTGVMGPETQNNYDGHQLVGLSKGLKGVYDLETLMENGMTLPDGSRIEGFKGQVNLDQGSRYMPALHGALTLLILAIVIGNVGVFLSRRKA